MKAIQVQQHGGPEVLKYVDIDRPEPGPGQLLIKIQAAGLNFIDTYHRIGLYPRELPFLLGLEGAGMVEAVGPGVKEFKVGDPVAYSNNPGSYAEYTVAPESAVVPVPEGLDPALAAASILQGMTAHYLVYSAYTLKAGETALVHAAAGGTGQLLVQMAKMLGATVIGTVSTEEKAQLAREAGVDHIILYTQTDFEEETRRLTGGRGVDVVYDSVGKDTLEKSMNVLRQRGHLVLFGQSSGRPPMIDPLALSTKGSLYLTRPLLFHYVATREELLWRSGDVFKWLKAGKLTVRVDRKMPLAQAAEAHRLLEGRQTAGKVLLIP